MEGEGVDFYCWHCLHNCLGGQFCGTLLPLYSVFGHFTGPPEWPPINQLRQWWFPALKSQLNSYETPLFKEQTLRKGEEKEENRYKGRQSLGRSVKKDCKKRLQRYQNLSTTPRILGKRIERSIFSLVTTPFEKNILSKHCKNCES